jgi:hypothetical protein
MRKLIFILFLIPCLFLLNPLETKKDGKNKDKKNIDYYEEIHELADEISLLNLINALNLTKEQMQQIHKLAVKAVKTHEDFDKINLQLAEETRALYKTLKQELIDKGTEVPKEIQNNASQTDKKLKQAKYNLDRELKELEKETEKVFTEGQMKIIVEFKNCLIPPKNLKNPTRAGQAYDSGPTENLLAKAKKMNDEEFKKDIEQIIKDLIEYEQDKYLGELSQEEFTKEKARIMNLFQMARSMNDADFLLNKTALAQEMDLKYKKDQLEKLVYYLSQGKSHNNPGKVGSYFLDSRIIPIIEQKIRIAKSFKKPEEPNLDNVKSIDSGDRVKKEIVK